MGGVLDNGMVEPKSFDFSVRIVNLYRFLTEEKKEYVLSKQVLRSGTSIGANVSEGERGQSKADFYSKMSIALKEANETRFWLNLLFETGYIDEQLFKELDDKCTRLRVMLIASCKTTKNNMSNDIL